MRDPLGALSAMLDHYQAMSAMHDVPVRFAMFYRTAAEDLDRRIRELFEPPKEAEVSDVDVIDGYDLALGALRQAAKALDDLASLGGGHMPRKAGSRARVVARRCDRAAAVLSKAGEL
jgi:hypothetical protein